MNGCIASWWMSIRAEYTVSERDYVMSVRGTGHERARVDRSDTRARAFDAREGTPPSASGARPPGLVLTSSRIDVRTRCLNGTYERSRLRSGECGLRTEPERYIARSMAAMAEHVRAMLELRRAGAVTFDYGNNIRAQALKAGIDDAFEIPGFVPEYIRPLFCLGKGPFRWVALSGDPADIAATDALAPRCSRHAALCRWIRMGRSASPSWPPARILWPAMANARGRLAINDLVRAGRAGADRDRPLIWTPGPWRLPTVKRRTCATEATRLPIGRS